ncbi:GNAT family N-acetyltransferase [Clostridium tagluense]|uniref:GNAT family N-acetyltransferase n=1 Tax=Clostridium tagluense TaxID=360422 RepID=UPI001CF4A5C3|nr:GNAT family protein [Clostridium tagluense]MCB2297184.1 GNAT family N-acetyltransferase [Clostridium tagluense]
MKVNAFLYGENMYLRALSEQDIFNNYKYWFNDDEVCRGNSHHRFPKNEESLKKYIVESNIEINRIVLAIIEKNEEIHIGNVSLQNINYFNRSAEFAVIIGEKEYWGKGYGKEATALIINHGFNTLNLNRIYCGTYSNNVGMQQIAFSLGFKQEGLRREADYKEGKYIDVIEYGLLKKEWEKIRRKDYEIL